MKVEEFQRRIRNRAIGRGLIGAHAALGVISPVLLVLAVTGGHVILSALNFLNLYIASRETLQEWRVNRILLSGEKLEDEKEYLEKMNEASKQDQDQAQDQDAA